MAKKKPEDNGETVPETKADKFRRLCNLRLGQLEKVAKRLASLANKKSYEYTDAQKDTVQEVCDAAFRLIEASFEVGTVVKPDMEAYV